MLVNAKNMLLEAQAARQGMPSPDFFDYDSARSYIVVAEERKRPLILAYSNVFDSFFPVEDAAVIGKYLSEKASVPVALHLDHGFNIDFIEKAIKCGFTSVMLDASSYPFEENVRMTREVVELARKFNVTVESEIGHVGMGSNFLGIENEESTYTSVEEATAFVAQTGVDSLAVSIGTAHGLYKGRKPVLNFERLRELRTALSVPLVLHGSTGTGDDNLRRCVEDGITKVNVYTEFLVGAMRAVKANDPETTGYHELKTAINQEMKKSLHHCFDVYGF